jgi:RNA polymerase sigma factor (sigma-70 family)
MKREASSREQRRREAIFALIGRHLAGLYRYARHLLKYYEATGDLPPGSLNVEDVVDAVVLLAYRELASEHGRSSIPKKLMQLARAYVESEVRRMNVRREYMVSKEEHVPPTPPQEWVSELGEEIFEFFEPDEYLRIEDVAPDLDVPTPEEEVDREETQRCVDAALATMPEEWRRALALRYIRGIKGAALAAALGKTAPEVNRILEHARQYLRGRLIESGCVVTQ